MVPFNLYAFAPFGVLLVTAIIGTAISIWINLTQRRRPLPVRNDAALRPSAEILAFPMAKRGAIAIHGTPLAARPADGFSRAG